MAAGKASVRGFTLIEILVALAVVALGLAAIIQTTGGYIGNQSYLRDRTLAHWVARNTLTQYQVRRDWPSVGEQSDVVEMAEREWEWRALISQTEDEDLRRVDIEVRALGGAEGAPLARFVGFLEKP